MSVTQAVEELVRATVALPDDALERPWSWRDYDEEGLRFTLLMAHHELRDLAVRLEHERVRAGAGRSIAERILAQFHQAYRDLTGALAPVSESEIDADPGEEQWALRQILAHVLGAESAFRTSIGLAVRLAREGAQRKPTEEEWDALDVAEEPAGDKRAVLDALFRSHVRVLRELGDIADDEIGTPSYFWEGQPYPVRFRLHRFEAHLRQHTVQVDKTLAMLARRPTEAQRLVRLIFRALADVETQTFGVDGHEAQVNSEIVIAQLAREAVAAAG